MRQCCAGGRDGTGGPPLNSVSNEVSGLRDSSKGNNDRVNKLKALGITKKDLVVSAITQSPQSFINSVDGKNYGRIAESVHLMQDRDAPGGIRILATVPPRMAAYGNNKNKKQNHTLRRFITKDTP